MATVDDAQAAYWNAPITRADAQNVFDEYAGVLVKMQEQVLKHEFLTGFLMAKFNVTPEEVQTWMNAKAAEFKAQQDAAAAQAPPAPDITLN